MQFQKLFLTYYSFFIQLEMKYTQCSYKSKKSASTLETTQFILSSLERFNEKNSYKQKVNKYRKEKRSIHCLASNIKYLDVYNVTKPITTLHIKINFLVLNMNTIHYYIIHTFSRMFICAILVVCNKCPRNVKDYELLGISRGKHKIKVRQ